MTEVLTYESIYETLREEKYKQELQPIDKNFYKNIIAYLQEKQKTIDSQRGKESIFSEQIKKTQKQLESVKKMIKEIYERRENKLLQLALFASRSKREEDTSNMLNEEHGFFKSIFEEINKYRNGILNSVLTAQSPVIEKKEPEAKTKEIKREESEPENTKEVTFIHAVPKFMGTDMKVYGPFESGEKAKLPGKLADVLITKQRVEETNNESKEEYKKILPVL